VVAADNISLDVAQGEFVTLLGPSGCGKTTTLRIVAGLIEPTAGEMYFDDHEISHIPPNRRNVGFVFQSHALFPHLNVADNVAFGLSVRGVKKEFIKARVQEMLALVNLEGYDKRMPAQLSGGQQQRVALARVLATDPRVLLFDEPLSSLDRALRDQLKYSIRELQQKTGKTAIYVTHDQSEAFAISDRIFVMNSGRIEQGGTQVELYLHPHTRFVAEFLGSTNCLQGTVVEAEPRADGSSRMSVEVGGRRLLARHSQVTAPGTKVLAYLRPENIAVLEPGQNGTANVVDGTIERIVFGGSVVHLTVDTALAPLLVEVGGKRRLELMAGAGSRVRLGFDELTIVPAGPAAARSAETDAR
jgi:putative spermidine/putrescine transport system ATP-binding protein